MILSLIDYLRYIRTPGRFGNLNGHSIMRHAFKGHLPHSLIQELQPGDLIFVQTLNSLISWGIMYLTKAEISHVAIYAGNKTITHATTSGIVSEPLDVLFSADCLLVPCGLRLDASKQEKLTKVINAHIGKAYDWRAVWLKGLRIVLGREPLYFRFSYILDLCLALSFIDLPFLLVYGNPVFLFLVPALLLVVGVNLVLGRLRPLPLNRQTAKPVEIFLVAWRLNADFYLKPNMSKPQPNPL